MSKAKSNDKDFLHDNNNKADKKIICGVKNTQVLNVERDLLSHQHTAKCSQSVKQEVPLHRAWVQGRVCACSKVVRNTAMDVVVFSFESYHLVNAGISEDLKRHRFFSSHHTGGPLLGEVLYSLKGSRAPSQSSPWLQ